MIRACPGLVGVLVFLFSLCFFELSTFNIQPLSPATAHTNPSLLSPPPLKLKRELPPAQSSSPIKTAAVSTVLHNPRLSPTADCVIFIVRTILFEIR